MLTLSYIIHLDFLENSKATMHNETIKKTQKKQENEMLWWAAEDAELNLLRLVTDPQTQMSGVFLAKSLTV